MNTSFPSRPLLIRQVGVITDNYSSTSFDLNWLKKKPLAFKQQVAREYKLSNATLAFLEITQ